MAKVTSLIDLNGKVGNYVYYKLRGKKVVRTISTKKKDPDKPASLILVQQNMEFGKASSANKLLRTAMIEEFNKLHVQYLNEHLSKLMMKLKSFDSAPSGSRTVAGGLTTENGQNFLRSFNFHKKSGHFPRILKAANYNGVLHLDLSTTENTDVSFTELQIDFENETFRRHVHVMPETGQQGKVILEKQFKFKKGFTDLVFIHGKKFLQGCSVIESGKNRTNQ